jgi:predicted nucleic acid-binding protein
MSRDNFFLDSSALISGVSSSVGASRALLQLAENGLITITISEQVVAETERAIARKLPRAVVYYRQTINDPSVQIIHDPAPEDLQLHLGIISHLADVPIVVAAMKAGVDYLVTLNRRHFIDDPQVAIRSGLRIGTPGDALTWFRAHHI